MARDATRLKARLAHHLANKLGVVVKSLKALQAASAAEAIQAIQANQATQAAD